MKKDNLIPDEDIDLGMIPPSVGMLQTIRHANIDPQSAILDILDNGYDAQRENIKKFGVAGTTIEALNEGGKAGANNKQKAKFLVFADPGIGMDENILKQYALRFAAGSDYDPSHHHEKSQGKFGVGALQAGYTLGVSYYYLTKMKGMNKLLYGSHAKGANGLINLYQTEIRDATYEEKVFWIKRMETEYLLRFKADNFEDMSGTCMVICDLLDQASYRIDKGGDVRRKIKNMNKIQRAYSKKGDHHIQVVGSPAGGPVENVDPLQRNSEDVITILNEQKTINKNRVEATITYNGKQSDSSFYVYFRRQGRLIDQKNGRELKLFGNKNYPYDKSELAWANLEIDLLDKDADIIFGVDNTKNSVFLTEKALRWIHTTFKEYFDKIKEINVSESPKIIDETTEQIGKKASKLFSDSLLKERETKKSKNCDEEEIEKRAQKTNTAQSIKKTTSQGNTRQAKKTQKVKVCKEESIQVYYYDGKNSSMESFKIDYESNLGDDNLIDLKVGLNKKHRYIEKSMQLISDPDKKDKGEMLIQRVVEQAALLAIQLSSGMFRDDTDENIYK